MTIPEQGPDRQVRGGKASQANPRDDPRRARIAKGGHDRQRGLETQADQPDARIDMEKLFDGPMYLDTFVKVKSGWVDDKARLRAHGYE